MLKRLYVSDGSRMAPAVIRNYAERDFPGLVEVQAESFPPPYPSELWWNEEQLRAHVTRFPEGALCAEVDGRIVGSMTALRRTFREGDRHDWASVTDDGYIGTHEPDGETLYVADICVRPAYRSFGLGKWLMQSMYETVVQLGCRRLLGAGRMPGYRGVSGELTPERYVAEVAEGRRKDPVLTFLLRCGRSPAGVVRDYLDDEDSCGNAALMEWRNPFKP
ncbi:GNAT family N-acetyltransferase [Cohnella nanjingensis]|uniref:GNAT family N-acetyltransferase n=1 Tax=Cohnella nanjingensis TaxID=1387779 RepID=A0A7X0RKL0_9BACL|nr:GNAT family N-acetyltransferase [Cohnella nanjingensis]MBB6669183.1 GNAT family N-acetyltransferase [Cohnella nanjingensis]